MNFIELIFHVAPDRGSGLLEAGFVLLLLAVPLVFSAVHTKFRRRVHNRAS